MKTIYKLINLILPKQCLICHSYLIKDIGDLICLECWKKTRFLSGPSCPICGKPFSSAISLSESPDHICGLCRKKRPCFDKHIYVGLYDGILSEAIRHLKYKKKVSLAYPLSYLLCRKIKDIPEVDVIIPVPLHTRRLRYREFNQSLLLSNLLTLHLGKPMLKDLMVRNKDTKPQAELDKEERRRNIKDIFSVTSRYSIAGKKILLVDDVFTTGSTVNECAKVLKKSGADKVYAITLALTNI